MGLGRLPSLNVKLKEHPFPSYLTSPIYPTLGSQLPEKAQDLGNLRLCFPEKQRFSVCPQVPAWCQLHRGADPPGSGDGAPKPMAHSQIQPATYLIFPICV